MRIWPWSDLRPSLRRGKAAESGGTSLAVFLLGIVTAVGLPLLALVGATVWGQYRAERMHELTQLEARARGLARQVDDAFATLETVAQTLANSATLARGDIAGVAPELDAARRALSAGYPASDPPVRVRLFNRDGTLLYDTQPAHDTLPGSNIVARARPFVMRAIATGTPQISDLFRGQRDNLPYIGVAVPVFAPSGAGPDRHVTGAVVIRTQRGRLLAIADAALLPLGGRALVHDRTGIVAAASSDDAATLGKLPTPAVLQAMMGALSGVTPGLGKPAGRPCIVAFARAPVSGFIVTLDVPWQGFLAQIRHVFIRTALIAGIVLLFCAGLALVLGRRIARAFQRVPALAAAQAAGAALESTGVREADSLAAVLHETLARRRRAEALLSESEERLRLAVEAAEVGLWDVDPIADCLYWPPLVKAMFGISPDAPVSMVDFYAGLHPDDRERVTEAYAAALDPAKRALYDVTFRTVGKEDGAIRWVAAQGRGLFDANGCCVRVIGTCIDTTVRRATARQLRELNETLEQRVAQATQERDRVWQNSRDVLAVGDTNGTLRAVNPAATAVLGYAPHEVIGRNFADYVWPADAETARHGFEIAASVGNLTSFELRLRHKDGTPRWLSWHTTREGSLIYAYGRDITAEKAAAAELAMAQEALHQAQKIETIGQLTGGVAHDFNNLLTPIVGALDVLNRRLAGDPQAQRMTGAALQAADRARTLIQRLLAFSRRQNLEARAVDVRALIESLVELASRSLGPQIDLTLRIADRLPPARVDPNQLELALLNLAVNARDAMDGIGTLTVTATEETTALRGKLLPGHYIRIAVTDTGCGMDAETLQRAVEPFFTTKQDGRGTGLGLSMVHGLAAQSGGDFTLQSAVGEGTTAILRLPVSDEDVAGVPVDAPPAAVAHGRQSATILLVDDEELVRTGVADMLEDVGFTVAQAASGNAAVTLVKAGLRPDVLVTDYAMPGMTGVALAKALREILPALPVLLVTGYARLDGGAVDGLPRLSKPFRQADMLAALAGLLNNVEVLEGTW